MTATTQHGIASPVRLPRRVRRMLVAGLGVCWGCFLALALIVLYALLAGQYPEIARINLLTFLLSLLLGWAGGRIACRWRPEVPHPIAAAVGLAAWSAVFAWASREALDVQDRALLWTFLAGAGLLILGRAFVRRGEPIASAAPRPRSAVPRAAAGGLLALLAGAYVVEHRARTGAEEVYDFFLSSGDWVGARVVEDADRIRMPRTEVVRLLRERFGLEPEQSPERDRCTWQGAVNTYELAFVYDSRDGGSGSKVHFTRTARWEVQGGEGPAR